MNQGKLRRRITARDIPPMMLMAGIVADFESDANPGLWERDCAILIDGLSAGREPSSLSPDALSESELALAASKW